MWWLLAVLALAPPATGEPTSGWVWPLDPPPTVIRGFQPPPEPWLAGHRGVDLASATGQSVRSAGAGTVAFAGMVAGRPVVSVSHGALRTTYEPVDAIVTPGQAVQAGEIIGTLAATRGHCGPAPPCLHWGLRRGEMYLDPLLLLDDAPIRLLPLWAGAAAPAPAPAPTRSADAASTLHTTTAGEARTAPVAAAAIVATTGLVAGGLALAGYRRGRA